MKVKCIALVMGMVFLALGYCFMHKKPVIKKKPDTYLPRQRMYKAHTENVQYLPEQEYWHKVEIGHDWPSR